MEKEQANAANKRGVSKENLKKLVEYLKLNDFKSDIQHNRGVRKRPQ